MKQLVQVHLISVQIAKKNLQNKYLCLMRVTILELVVTVVLIQENQDITKLENKHKKHWIHKLQTIVKSRTFTMVRIISTEMLRDYDHLTECDYSANDYSTNEQFEEYLDSVKPENRTTQPQIVPKKKHQLTPPNKKRAP